MEATILERRGALFYGFEHLDVAGNRHRNVAVLRGNGNLRLTEQGLHFSRWVAPLEIFIPAASIQKTEIGSSHNGKWTPFMKILKVYFDEEGVTKILGVALGYKSALATEWKERVDALAGRGV